MNSKQFHIPSPLQRVNHSALEENDIELYIKRDDLIHAEVSGNKWRKLRLNFEQARFKGKKTVLTFGGAHSNHIAATAKAAQIFGMNSIGIIRGEEADMHNPTLSFSRNCGMQLVPISRAEYRNIDSRDYKESLKSMFGDFYLIPQGGANFYGVQGSIDVIKEINTELKPDAIFVASGTGTTLSGILLGNQYGTKIKSVSALKGGDFLLEEARKNLMEVYQDEETTGAVLENLSLLTDYHFGGFARVKPELVQFMREFYRHTGIVLDPIYTAKAAFALLDKALTKHNKNPEKWVLIHTGGLQGIPAMEEKLGYKIY